MNEFLVSAVMGVVVVLVIATGVFFKLPTIGGPFYKKGGETDIAIFPRDGRKRFEVVADGLEVPWDIAFMPEGGMLVTERPGRIRHLGKDGKDRVFILSGVEHSGEGGLLGIALHPDFRDNRFVYLYQTGAAERGLLGSVLRYRYGTKALSFDRIITGGIPASPLHGGGRIAFGPDSLLYITVGDAGDEDAAEDTTSLAGSILRVRDDGAIPPDTPFGNAVYSYGHRNPQGIDWDAGGRLWSTEHGRFGYDEINLIMRGANYGWPGSEGERVAEDTIAPVLHSGADETWAPASALYHEGSLYFGGLRGEALYEAVLRGEEIVELREHFKGEFGRIRTVRLGPDGFFYITTSNRDGRGTPREGDDKIIRVDPASF